MAKVKKAANTSKKKPIEQYDHKGEEADKQPAGGIGYAGDGQGKRQEDLHVRSAS